MKNRFSAARVSLTAAAVVTALIAAGCSSSESPSKTGKAGTTSLSSVTLNIGDQKGTGAEALLTAAGLINKLPFHAVWSDFTSGPPMLQAMGSGSVDIGGGADGEPAGGRAAGAEELFDPLGGAAARQADRDGAGQLGQLPPAGRAGQG